MQKLRLNPWFFLPYLLVLIIVGIVLLVYPKGTFLLWLNHHHTSFLDSCFMVTNALGEEIFAGTVIGGLLLFTRYSYGLAAALAWLLSGCITQSLKHFVFHDLVRPFRFFEGVHEIYFVPGVEMSQHHTFPSGHTTVAFALCSVLAVSVKHKALGLFFLLMGLIAGLSRIYLAQHFLVDTYFGSLIGTITGVLVCYFMQQHLADKPTHVLHRNVLQSLKG